MEAVVHRSALSGAVLLVAAALLFAACLGPQNPFPERSVLLAEPAATLRMAGAEELAKVGDERRMTIEGPISAFEGAIFGSQASALEVFAFYDRELRRLGWVQDRFVIRSTVELDAWGWCKPRLLFRLAIKDRERAFEPRFYQGRTYATVFDARIRGRDPDAPCPNR